MADAKKTPSGLAYKVLQQGVGGRHPRSNSEVTVHYTGWTPEGRQFDSSLSRGRPTKFPLSAVIKGWTEGVQLLTVGDRARFWIPAALACSPAPNGRARWTMKLLADKLVEMEVVESIDPATVWRTLKKTTSSRGSNNRGSSRPKPTRRS